MTATRPWFPSQPNNRPRLRLAITVTGGIVTADTPDAARFEPGRRPPRAGSGWTAREAIARRRPPRARRVAQSTSDHRVQFSLARVNRDHAQRVEIALHRQRPDT